MQRSVGTVASACCTVYVMAHPSCPATHAGVASPLVTAHCLLHSRFARPCLRVSCPVCFKVFDSDNDGVLSVQDLHHLLSLVVPIECTRVRFMQLLFTSIVDGHSVPYSTFEVPLSLVCTLAQPTAMSCAACSASLV